MSIDKCAIKERPYFRTTSTPTTEPLRLEENVFVNEYITRYLKTYQIEGVRFLYSAYKEERGAILADEMGLGKTIQVIAFLAAVLNKKGVPTDLDHMLLDCIKKQRKIVSPESVNKKPFLICCPASVINNWINELETWGYFAVSKFHSANERKETLKKLQNQRCEVVLTSHETCRIHIDELMSFEWSAIIVDEFHKIKNDESLVSQAFHTFQTKTRIGLSGTILQNDLIELWALLDWVNPGCLGDKKAFIYNYCKPIVAGQSQKATKLQLLRKVEKTNILKQLKKKWVLRRTKAIISNQLPKKGFADHDVDEILVDAQPDALRTKHLFYRVENCGKMKVLDAMLEEFHRQKSTKVLLFSYSTRLLDIVEKYVVEKSYSYVRLDGQTKNSTRQQIVDTFNKDEDIFLFLISTKAGGVGLNITGANVVIIFDPNWNPTHDLQAQDRAYRLGQKREVHVYRLISAGCIEENIYLRQIYKMHLSKECVEGESSKRLFDMSSNNKRGEFLGVENLFGLDQESADPSKDRCKTRDILKRYLDIEKGIAGLEVSNFVETNRTSENESEEEENVKLTETHNEEDDEYFFDEKCASFADNDEYENTKNEEESDDDQDDTNIHGRIGKIFKNNDVVHIHETKALCSSSKIESHIRKCVQEEAAHHNIVRGENAFQCNVIPQLSTLDYVELDKADYEFTKNVKVDHDGRFQLSDGSFVHYGNVPIEIRKEQFKQMATRLKLSTEQLATTIMSWTPEERYVGMKKFYLSTFPKSSEFYESFSKFKRKMELPNESNEEANRTKKSKTDHENEMESRHHLDYYENLNTFENVLGLIEDELVSNSETDRDDEDKTSKSGECDRLYEKFMNNTAEIDKLVKIEDEHYKSNSLDFSKSAETVSKHLETNLPSFVRIKDSNNKSEKSSTQDKYDRLLDDIFD